MVGINILTALFAFLAMIWGPINGVTGHNVPENPAVDTTVNITQASVVQEADTLVVPQALSVPQTLIVPQIVEAPVVETPASQSDKFSDNISMTAMKNNPNIQTAINKIKAYDQIKNNSYTLMNNVWGAPKTEQLVSGIYLNPDGTFGWAWDRSAPKMNDGATSVLPIYPSLRIGGNRWERTASGPFPLKLGDIKSLTFDINYRYITTPAGCYDLSYDLFLSEPDQPDSSPRIKAEVMIWLGGSQGQPKQYYKGDFSDGNNTFALYSWVMADGRTYYSFILKPGSQLQGQYKIDAQKLLSELNLEPTLLIHGLEFGNEVWNGSGQIQIQQFSITLNGKEL